MALSAARIEPREAIWLERKMPLNGGSIAYAGGMACLDIVDGMIKPGAAGPTLLNVGIFQETVDNSGGSDGDLSVNVTFHKPIRIRWFLNDTGGGAFVSTDRGKDSFVLDDQTVTKTADGASKAGRVWDVATKDGSSCVAVEAYEESPVAPLPVLAAYTSNDTAPASIVNGGIYDVPTTGAASTITLPAASPDGTKAFFAADGTKNGHTVQYRDATGPTNLTTALTASKRHLVVVVKEGGKWFANAYVSP